MMTGKAEWAMAAYLSFFSFVPSNMGRVVVYALHRRGTAFASLPARFAVTLSTFDQNAYEQSKAKYTLATGRTSR